MMRTQVIVHFAAINCYTRRGIKNFVHIVAVQKIVISPAGLRFIAYAVINNFIRVKSIVRTPVNVNSILKKYLTFGLKRKKFKI